MIFILEEIDGLRRARHSFSYDENQIKRILTIALHAAKLRRKKMCVITKPGGAPSISALWKQCAETITRDRDVELQMLEVDNAAYQIIADAKVFDVIVAPNMFGDIIADGAALLIGSRGLSYSANFGSDGKAVYQTGHGAAYDIMGQDRANPLGQLYSLAMMLHESFGLTWISMRLLESIDAVLKQGWRTSDMMEPGCTRIGTYTLAQRIGENLKERLLGGGKFNSALIQFPRPETTKPGPALLLIDLQNDFLDRLESEAAKMKVVAGAAALLSFCRERKIPVLHIHTQTKREGWDRMPHWVRNDYHACIEDSNGAMSPSVLQPVDGEPVIYKRFFNPFNNKELHETLQSLNVDNVILSGLYSHACVRATAMEAYERGYTVWIGEDAIDSTEPLHAELSRSWLHGRAAEFFSVDEIKNKLGWESAKSIVPAASARIAADACHAAHDAWQKWRRVPLAERCALLVRWKAILCQRLHELTDLLVTEIAKPVRDAKEELQRMLAHIDHALTQAKDESDACLQVKQRYRPAGCYAIITPWNNPAAIPVSKIAPALLFGNTVVWKSAPQSPLVSRFIMNTLVEAGLAEGCVNLVFGNEVIARAIIADEKITAVSVTGSVDTGKNVAALCGRLGKPLQAELGGNNACIILPDVDLPSVMENLALSAFSFAGQRCTATRRFIVHEAIAKDFEILMIAAVKSLRLGNPDQETTQVGPVINATHLHDIQQHITAAVAAGARIACGGKTPADLNGGCLYEPTLITDAAEDAAIVQQETFGPVAVIQVARDIQHAVSLANGVQHGLLASLLTNDQAAIAYFEENIEAGILKLVSGPLMIKPDAPFGGWKASGYGLPEHGEWDRMFYTRPQAVYS